MIMPHQDRERRHDQPVPQFAQVLEESHRAVGCGSRRGLSHFKLKWIGRPLMVKDTAISRRAQASLRRSVPEGSWFSTRRRLISSTVRSL
jgi:hypothetical protein